MWTMSQKCIDSNFSLLKHCIISIELFSFASENKDDIPLWLSVRGLENLLTPGFHWGLANHSV